MLAQYYFSVKMKVWQLVCADGPDSLYEYYVPLKFLVFIFPLLYTMKSFNENTHSQAKGTISHLLN
jgi:hypothetical protein